MKSSKQTAFDFLNNGSTLSANPRVARQSPIERLLSVTGYPVRPILVPTDDHWRVAEEELRVIFPRSFKELLGLYGTGIWCQFIELFSPHPNCRHYKYCSQHVLEAVGFYRGAEAIQSFELWPAKGGLLPLAVTNTRMSLAWDTSTKDPDDWNIVIIPHDRPPEILPGSILEFLYLCVSGRTFRRYLPRFTSSIKYRCGWGPNLINPFES